MVKAADIGKGARDYIKKDFFSGNEVKVNQGGCGKNTTTFKLGDSVKGDHKIELAKCPFGSPFAPASFKLGSDMGLEAEAKYNKGAKTTITLNTNLASVTDLSALSLKKSFEFNKDISGISTVLDLTSTMKGVSPGPIEFGLALDKTGIQLGITGTATLAGEVSGTKIRVGYAPCPAGNVAASAVTTSGKDWVLDAKIIKNGRTYALDFDANKLSGNVATNIPNGKVKVSTGGVMTTFQKYPISEVCSARFGASLDLQSGKMSGVGMGLDFSL
jgi:hypothetical protein